MQKCVRCREEIPIENALYCPHCGKKQQKTAKPKPLKRTNGRGCVFKLSGRRRKPWAIRINHVYMGFYAERGEALEALEAMLLNGTTTAKHNYTLADIYTSWAASYITDKTNSKTREEKEQAWKRLSVLGSRKMRDIKTSDYQRVIDTAMTVERKRGDGTVISPARPLSTAAKQHIKKLASQLCQHAMKDDIINKNYAGLVTMPEKDAIHKDIFTDQQIDILWQHSKNRDVQIILLLLYTGLRINELLGMKRENVNLDEGYMIGGSKTVAGRDRYIPIAGRVLPLVSKLYDEGHEYLVTNSAGNRHKADNYRVCHFYPTLETLGIVAPAKKGERRTLTPHSTRHTFFNRLRTLGADKDLTTLVMGHEHYEDSVEMYGKVTDKDKARLKMLVDEL